MIFSPNSFTNTIKTHCTFFLFNKHCVHCVRDFILLYVMCRNCSEMYFVDADCRPRRFWSCKPGRMEGNWCRRKDDRNWIREKSIYNRIKAIVKSVTSKYCALVWSLHKVTGMYSLLRDIPFSVVFEIDRFVYEYVMIDSSVLGMPRYGICRRRLTLQW